MGNLCENCRYAKADVDSLRFICTNRDMPEWFNVCIYEGRQACDKFELNSVKKPVYIERLAPGCFPPCCPQSNESLEKETKLVYICNEGCDASTYGVARFSQEGFAEFSKAVIELNKNSYYQCMPTIHFYEIKEDDLLYICEEGAMDRGKVEDCGYNNDGIDTWPTYPLYLDGKWYAIKSGVLSHE